MLFFIFMLHNVNIESLQGAFFSKLCTMTSHQFWFKGWSLVDQRGNSFHKSILKVLQWNDECWKLCMGDFVLWKYIWAFVLNRIILNIWLLKFCSCLTLILSWCEMVKHNLVAKYLPVFCCFQFLFVYFGIKILMKS